ncbi:SPW repeat protein [Microbispora sp. NBC_01189]|uniref:SPW repeat protein n=1 Tax=Microbispora sp. NBC_01189 TaxID=2903583 RepID=UPI002E145CFD|nr:SPW repeat protein [Microbispora sp. NBC_01189]
MVRPGLARRPDVTELRQTYDRAGSTAPAQVMDAVTLLAGLYLAISPWIVGFTGFGGLTVNNLIVGLVVTALALSCASAFGRTYGVSWVTPVLGVWAIIAPWVIRGQPATTATIWNNVVTGAIIFLFGLGALAFAANYRQHEHGRRGEAGASRGEW